MKLTIALLLTALMVTGCSVLDKIEESPVTSEIITNQLTLRFIADADDPVERAQNMRDTLTRIQSSTEGAYTLIELESRVREEIDWTKYNLADQELLNFGLTKAREVISDLVGEGVLDPEERVTVDTLFRWIDQAAARVQ
jgi:hypothetical protein